MDLSIVIPTYNRGKSIITTLDLIYQQRIPKKKIEVIIVNDGSKDDTEHHIKNYIANHKEITWKYIKKQNAGPANARQIGWQNAASKIILFTDDDCMPDKNWIRSYLEVFNTYDIGLAGGFNTSDPNQKRTWLITYIESLKDHQSKKMKIGGKELNCYATMNMAYRRKTLEKIKGFDTTMFDDDYKAMVKACNAGNKLAYVPQAIVYHRQRENLKDYIKMDCIRRAGRILELGESYFKQLPQFIVMLLFLWLIITLLVPSIGLFLLLVGYIGFILKLNKHALHRFSKKSFFKALTYILFYFLVEIPIKIMGVIYFAFEKLLPK